MSIQKSGRAQQGIISFADLFLLCGFDDAVHRADRDALWRVEVTFTFDTGSLINNIQNAIALTDRFSRAFGDACTTGNAFFIDFHGHKIFSS